MIKIAHIFFILTFVSNFIVAQDSIHKNPFWLNLSLGGSSKYLNAGVSYNKALENFSYQIAINETTEGILSRYGMSTGNIGIGLSKNKEWLISSIFFGPSLSYGEANDISKSSAYFGGFGFTLNA